MRRNSPETKSTPFRRKDEVIASSTPIMNGAATNQKETVMADAIAKAFSSLTPAISADFDSLKTVVLFSAVGLLLCLVAANYGLDYGAF